MISVLTGNVLFLTLMPTKAEELKFALCGDGVVQLCMRNWIYDLKGWLLRQQEQNKHKYCVVAGVCSRTAKMVK